MNILIFKHKSFKFETCNSYTSMWAETCVHPSTCNKWSKHAQDGRRRYSRELKKASILPFKHAQTEIVNMVSHSIKKERGITERKRTCTQTRYPSSFPKSQTKPNQEPAFYFPLPSKKKQGKATLVPCELSAT